jgi:Ca2+-binding RTX toxin-like protein
VGAIVSQKAQALFSGGQAQDRYQQQFGTMSADVITGQWTAGAPSKLEIYGLGGDDILIAAERGDQSLFGGDGRDTFRLSGDDPLFIRDLEAGETIQVSANRADALTLGPSRLGGAFTDLSSNGRLLAHLDGQWSAADLTLASWA